MKNHKRLLYIIVLVFTIALTAAITHALPLTTAQKGQLPTTTPTIYDLWQDTNAERMKAGLQPLVLDSKLDDSASAKCSDMVAKGYWAHTSPTGKQAWQFVVASGNKYVLTGENLAFGYKTSRDTMTAWMNSPEHKTNILRPEFTDVGFAICSDTQNPDMVVQHFTERETLE